jgi:hypothetical protein
MKNMKLTTEFKTRLGAAEVRPRRFENAEVTGIRTVTVEELIQQARQHSDIAKVAGIIAVGHFDQWRYSDAKVRQDAQDMAETDEGVDLFLEELEEFESEADAVEMRFGGDQDAFDTALIEFCVECVKERPVDIDLKALKAGARKVKTHAYQAKDAALKKTGLAVTEYHQDTSGKVFPYYAEAGLHGCAVDDYQGTLTEPKKTDITSGVLDADRCAKALSMTKDAIKNNCGIDLDQYEFDVEVIRDAISRFEFWLNAKSEACKHRKGFGFRFDSFLEGWDEDDEFAG